jgi:DNA-binding response OmpR family regulator
MATVVLLISDLTLVEPVKKALPLGARLDIIEVAFPQPWSSRFDSSDDVDIILVEVDKQRPPASWFSHCKQIGVPVITIISDPSDRNELFCAGASDCLLRPLVTQEIQARLGVYLQQEIKINEEDAKRESRRAQSLEKLSQQLIQNERWITIGRVVAAICHNITNRMQATQGALTLATEEPSLSDDMRNYLSICMSEIRRVNAYVERLRHVYHPDSDPVQLINLPDLLSEVSSLASDAAIVGKANLDTFVEGVLPEFKSRAGQLQFILLGILLNLIELTSAIDTAHIRVEARRMGPRVQILISTDSSLQAWAPQHNDQDIQEHALGLITFREVAAALKADLGFSSNDTGLKVWINLSTL